MAMVIAIGMLTASAQAATAPFWSIGGTRLAAGRTHNVVAVTYQGRNFTLSAPEIGLRITCKTATSEKGVLLGSNEGEPGKNNEVYTFGGCELVEGNGFPECKLENATLTTKQLISELVENVEGGVGGKQLLELLFPATGIEFMRVKFKTNEKCTLVETQVTGKLVGAVRSANEQQIELGQTPTEATEFQIRWPEPAITSVWLITAGVGKVVPTQLVAFGAAAQLKGFLLTLLANTKGEPEQARWSPLP